MAEIKEILGFNIKSLAADPLGAGTANGTWASGGNLNQIKGRPGFASNATSTTHVALVYGGNTPGKTANTEQYDGSSWTELANLNTARNGYGGSGTLTAAGYAGGEIPSNPYNTDAFELWDGSSWSETTEINTARRSIVGFGATNTASLVASGYVSAASKLTEVWNGSSWTEVGDQNAAKYGRGGTGTVTAGILFGGTDPTTNTETWNGTAWTEVSELNTKGEYRAASGTAAEVLAVGGYQATANVELWNGSAWTEINNISTARWEGAGTGSSSLGMISGGNTPPNTAATEEFTAATIADSIKSEGQIYYNSADGTMNISAVVDGTGAWASGANLNSAHSEKPGGAGTQNASLCFGGSSHLQTNEAYNGTAWTEVGDLNTGRHRLAAAKNGTTTATLAIGGEVPPNSDTVNVESWDGSSWSEVNNLNTARRLLGAAGTSTSAIGFAGTTAHPSANGETAIAEEWNGTAWTEVGDLNTARFGLASAGVNAESALAISGNTGSIVAVVEKWDGSSWTEVGDVNTGRDGRAAAGTTTSALGFGGYNPGNTVNTETWDGSSWTEVANLSTATNSASGTGGNNLLALNSGGNADTDGTEEWTVPQPVQNLVMSD